MHGLMIGGIPAVVVFAGLACLSHWRRYHGAWTVVWIIFAVSCLVGTTLLAEWLGIGATAAAGAIGSLANGVVQAIHAASSSHHGG